MTTWADVERAVPALAAAAGERLRAHKHLTMATLRADGAPRLCGTEVVFAVHELWLAGMPGARRFVDLRRDPRVEVHSGSDDPPDWTGDARVAGRAVEETDPDVLARFRGELGEAPPGPFELFRVDVTDVVLVRLGEPADHVVVESWSPGKGLRTAERR